MAEPLEVLLSRIRRQRPKAQYQPFEQEGGMNPGMRGSINPLDSQAISDRAQGVDISSVAPPTRLRADRMDEDLYQGKTPVNLASTDDGEQSPFRTAAGSNARQAQPVQQTQMQYRMQCGPNGCQRVPVLDASPSVQIQQIAAPSLPEGVQLSPGEQYVPGSLREGPPTQQQLTASRPTVPLAVATAQAPDGAPPWMNPQPFFDRAQQYYGQADSALASRNAIGTVQNNNRGNLHMQAGMQAAQLAELRRLNDIKQKNYEQMRGDKLKAEHRRTPKGQAELEAEVISMPGTTVQYRADQLLQLRQAARTQANMVFTPEQLAEERQMLEGAITASDAVRNQMRYQSLLDTAKANDAAGKPRGQGEGSRLKAAHAHLYDGLLNRYGKMADPAARRDAMSRELFPAYAQEYQDYYRKRPELLGGSPSEDDIANAAHDQAITRVQTNIARVDDMIAKKQSPWASLTHEDLMHAQAQDAAPAMDAAPASREPSLPPSAWGAAPDHVPLTQ